MSLVLRPLPITRAVAFVREVHRRLPKLLGGMWAVGVERDAVLVGVAVVGRPVARMLDDGLRLQVLRVACVEGDASASGHRGANSMLYGACSRAARALGASDLFTYLHHDEDAVTMRAAGWVEFTPTPHGSRQEWSRDGRQRKLAVDPVHKRRFFAPWSAMVKEREAKLEMVLANMPSDLASLAAATRPDRGEAT